METTRTSGCATPTSAGRLSVLLVDDNESHRRLITSLLHREFGKGVRIREAEEAVSALDLLEAETVDVILIDYCLPGMDGLELLDRLAERQIGSAAILMTGQGSETVAAEAIKRGAKDYLQKSDLSRIELRCAITQALQTVRLQRENARMVEQLHRTHEELDHFVRALSHDMNANFMLLQSSFSQLKESLEDNSAKRLAPREPLSHGQHELIAHVDACLRESKRFLDDLVRLAKTGSVEMEPARVELAAVVDAVLFEQQGLLDSRRVEVDVPPGLPVLWCNESRVKQIVTNLVRNAVLHGCDPMHPRITIARFLAKGTLAGFRLHDNGAGLPPRYCREIFLPGRRLAQAGPDGSGMGLAIVRKIVEHYGGAVYVDPECEAGTAFVVCLPDARGREIGAPQPAEDSTALKGRQWKLQLDARHEKGTRRRHTPLSVSHR